MKIQFSLGLIYVFLCYLHADVIVNVDNEKNDSKFVPTREWQVVNKGTPIPEGLHIRHNFQTGKTEAKLLDSDDVSGKSTENTHDKKERSLVLHADYPLKDEDVNSLEQSAKSTLKIPVEDLKLKLKKMKSDEAETQNRVEDVKKKFRSYQELKKNFEALNINITNEMELLKDFFQQFMENKDVLISKTPEKLKVMKILDVLDNLEYLFHQIDNAQVFADMGGMTTVISPCLNSTDHEIKSEALRLLGTAVQSNPKVQTKALESDFVQKILHILITNDNMGVKSRCLFALSSLLRQFPAAQKVFVDHGGLEVFGKILEGTQLQLQTKVLNLVNDLIIERKNIEKFTVEEQRRLRIKAYEATNFEQKLIMHEYCKSFVNLTKQIFQNVITRDFIEQTDEVQLFAESMITLNPVCENEFLNHRQILFPLIENVLSFHRKHNLEVQTSEDEELGSDLILALEKLKDIFAYTHDEL